MSSRAVRLPIVGASRVGRPSEPIPPIDDALRLPFAVPVIALIASHPRALDRSLLVLHHAAAALSKRVTGLHVRVSESARIARDEDGDLVIEAPLLALPASLLEAERSLGGVDLVIGTGAALVALRRARVSILVTDRRVPSEWGADVRSVRERVDLVVPEIDPSLARELFARL